MVSRFVMASMGVHVLAAVGVSGMHRVQTKNSPIVVEITRKTVEVKIPDVVPVPPPPVEVPPPQPPPEAEKVAPPAEANPLPALEPAPAPQQVAPAQALAPRPANTRVATAAWRGGGDGAGSGEGGGGAGGGVGTIGTGGTMGVTGAGDTRAFAPGTPGHGVLRDALASLFGVQPGNPAGTGQGSGAAASGGGGGARNAARDPSKTPVARTPEPPLPPDMKKCNGESLPAVDITSTVEHCGECGRMCSGKKVCVQGTCIGGDSLQFRLTGLYLHPQDDIGWKNANGGRDNGWLKFVDKLGQFGPAGFDWEDNFNQIIKGGFANTLLNVPPFEAPTEPVTIFVGTSPTTIDMSSQRTLMAGGSLTPASFTFQAPPGNTPPTLSFQVVQPAFTLTVPIIVDYLHCDFVPANGNPTVMSGELRGAIVVKNLFSNRAFITGMANNLDDAMHNYSDPKVRSLLKNTFDAPLGGKRTCTNPDGSTANKEDGKIDPCEVVDAKALLDDLLEMDRQMYNATGNYNANLPQTNGASYDSMTFGIKFEASRQQFGR